MGFSKQRNTIYMGISASERELLDLVEKGGLTVYRVRDVARMGGHNGRGRVEEWGRVLAEPRERVRRV